MTQQLDLTFNMTSTTDKMMSNSSLSYSSKENNSELNTQFGNYLDNANKSYSKNTRTNDAKNDNKTSYRNTDNKSVKSDNKNEQTSVKTEDKTTATTTTVSYDEETPKTANVISNEKPVEVNNVTVNETVSPAEEIEEIADMNELLQESILAANITDVVKMVSVDNSVQDKQAVTIDFSDKNEIPVEAIKSGITFDTALTDVDVTDADIDAVETVTQDMNVSKEDLISSMYETKTPVEQPKVIADVKPAEIEKEVKPQQVSEKIEIPKEQTEIPVAEVKVQEETVKQPVVTDDIKVEKIENTEEIKTVEPQTKDVKVETDTIQKQPVIAEKTEDKVVVPENKDNDKLIEINKVDLKVSNQKEENTEEQPRQVQFENVAKDVQPEIQENVVALNVNNTVSEVKAAEPKAKTEELKQEINSAKLENTLNNVQKETDKQVADKNAKTNVEAKETIDIKDDVSDIEFVNNKPVEKTVKEYNTEDTKVEHVKQKVENVKIQVEENVKINPNLVKAPQDENKVLKAQETLAKAGLSTENLQKLDAKIKDVDNSKNNSQSDLGQSAQETIMRDMMQNSMQHKSSEAVELKVDFNQTLNKMMQSNNVHQTQATEELPDVNILEQIRAKFALNSQNGMQKITIGLTPESLGKLQIEISKGMNGISAQILAENPQAKEILDKNLDGLKSVLQAQGVNVNNVNVKIAEAGRSSDSNNNMFNNEDSQFNSNNNGNNSKNSEDTNKEKRSEYEMLQKEALLNENSESSEEGSEEKVYQHKTVNIKGGAGNVKYQL